MFINFLHYKLDREGKVLVEIDRWFPSSTLCSNCHYQVSEMPLDVRAWTCPSCGTHQDRDANASINIRTEGIRMLSVLEGLLLMEGCESEAWTQVQVDAIPVEVRSSRCTFMSALSSSLTLTVAVLCPIGIVPAC